MSGLREEGEAKAVGSSGGMKAGGLVAIEGVGEAEEAEGVGELEGAVKVDGEGEDVDGGGPR